MDYKLPADKDVNPVPTLESIFADIDARLSAIENGIAPDVDSRLKALEAKLLPKKTAETEATPHIVRKGAAKDAKFATSPEVAAQLEKDYPRQKPKK
jgi:hypothetical protein